MPDRPNTPAWSRRRLLMGVGAAGGSGAMYRLGTALGLIPGFASAARPVIAPARGRRTVLILGAGISGLVAAYELGRAGYRLHGARSLAPRRRPQPHAAPRRQGRRTRQSADRARSTTTPTCISTPVPRAFRARTNACSTTAASSASSSRRSSTTTTTPGCRTTRCSAASRCAIANTSPTRAASCPSCSRRVLPHTGSTHRSMPPTPNA